jgi:hypothetical protein
MGPRHGALFSIFRRQYEVAVALLIGNLATRHETRNQSSVIPNEVRGLTFAQTPHGACVMSSAVVRCLAVCAARDDKRGLAIS